MPKPKVLVVEDTNADVDLITYHLHRVGFTVTVASNAEEALALLRSGDQPPLAMVDIRLPGMPGGELIRIIKREWPEIIIGVVSGGLPESDWASLRGMGATILFGKPFMDKDAYFLLGLIKETALAYERGRRHRTRGDYWRYGLISAFIGGFASMVENGVAIKIIAPEKLKLGEDMWVTVITIAGLALFNGVKLAAFYLKQSPLPPLVLKSPNGHEPHHHGEREVTRQHHRG